MIFQPLSTSFYEIRHKSLEKELMEPFIELMPTSSFSHLELGSNCRCEIAKQCNCWLTHPATASLSSSWSTLSPLLADIDKIENGLKIESKRVQDREHIFLLNSYDRNFFLFLIFGSIARHLELKAECTNILDPGEGKMLQGASNIPSSQFDAGNIISSQF